MLRRGGLSTPHSAQPQAQTAAETGHSLFSSHMGQRERDAEPSGQSKWGPPTEHYSLGLLLSNQGRGPRG